MRGKSRTDWKRVDAMTDEEIDYSEIPEVDEAWFDDAVLTIPARKEVVTIRIDRDVLEWFKSNGSRYQTRINALLRAYMEAQVKGNASPPRRVRTTKTQKSKRRA